MERIAVKICRLMNGDEVIFIFGRLAIVSRLLPNGDREVRMLHNKPAARAVSRANQTTIERLEHDNEEEARRRE